MAKVTVIEGLSDIHKYLQDLPVKLEKSILRGGLRAGAKVIADAAKAAAPAKSGALRDSIKVRSSTKKGKVSAIVTAGNAKAWYSHIIEFGSGSFYAGMGKKSKRKPYQINARRQRSLSFNGQLIESVMHPGVKPKPFLRPALDASQHEAIKAAADYMKKRIAKENLKNER